MAAHVLFRPETVQHLAARFNDDRKRIWHPFLRARSFRNTGQSIRRKRYTITSAAGDNDYRRRMEDAAESAKSNFSDAAKTFQEKAAESFSGVKREAQRFERENDVKGKAKQAFELANQKYEEFSDDVRRQGVKIDRKYKVMEKAKDLADAVSSQARDVDQRFGVRENLKAASKDITVNLPKYRRQLDTFLATPVGRFCSFMVFFWLASSGWLVRLFSWGLLILPFLPFILRSVAKNAIVQGVCPNCGMQYVGAKTSMLTCRKCRGIVWQPSQDFSKNDSNIIDIEVD